MPDPQNTEVQVQRKTLNPPNCDVSIIVTEHLQLLSWWQMWHAATILLIAVVMSLILLLSKPREVELKMELVLINHLIVGVGVVRLLICKKKNKIKFKYIHLFFSLWPNSREDVCNKGLQLDYVFEMYQESEWMETTDLFFVLVFLWA